MTTDMKAIAPGAIEGYAGRINNGVDQITEGLNALCAAITAVEYGGKNAFKFKTDASSLANSLSTKLHEAMTNLSTDVAKATTDLSGSLGGVAISISLNDNVVTPADPGADTDDGFASMAALDSLMSKIDESFETIGGGIKLVAAMPDNSQNGWMGDRRNATDGVVEEFVGLARENCKTTLGSLRDYISTQKTALDGQ